MTWFSRPIPARICRPERTIRDYDGVAWTGCSSCVFSGEPDVAVQIEFARECFRRGVPAFGSCWAAQIAVVAAGGEVALNPNGREMGIARGITLTDEGRAHPLYEGKPAVFDAFTSHDDEVTVLPDGAARLSGNDFTRVQSVVVEHVEHRVLGFAVSSRVQPARNGPADVLPSRETGSARVLCR